MAFDSILFPSPGQAARAGNCPWLTFRPRARAQAQTVTRGNKTFPAGKNNLTPRQQTPAFFADAGLDPVVDAALGGAEDTPLRRVYYALQTDAETVQYRQEIMRALEAEDAAGMFRTFCGAVESALRTMENGEAVHLPAQRDKYIVDGAVQYCEAVRALLAAAAQLELASEGLRLFLDAVRAYAAGPRFTQTEAMLGEAKDGIEAISFSLQITKGKVLVGPAIPGGDFVRETRDDFTCPEDGESAEPPREIRFFTELALGPLGILIADTLKKEHPDAFQRLQRAAEAAGAVPEPWILAFTREIRFYFGYLEIMRAVRAKGLPFAYPVLTGRDTVRVEGAYDLDLALHQEAVVTNACGLSAAERGIVITGANHSGKTTFLRALGQTAVLAALGLPVPCARAELPLFEGFYSHFSDAEEGEAQQGRLKEELVKLKPILRSAGTGSLVLLNEMFSSTTAQDAQAMAARVIGCLTGGGARVLCVTHTLGEMPEGMVSMVAQVAPDTHERLYRVVRAPAETHAHVDALIAKYRLDEQAIKERIGHGV